MNTASNNLCFGSINRHGDVINDDVTSVDERSETSVRAGRNVARMVAHDDNTDKCLPLKKRRKRKRCIWQREEVVPVLRQVDDHSCKLGHMEKTLDLVYKKLKLHEDNIDMLQEKLYLIQYGTPGTMFATIRFYFALFKCTVVPIIVVEVFYRLLFGMT